MFEIKDEISALIPNGLVVNEFAIEGEKGAPFKVERSTTEIREKIKLAFS